MPQQREGNESGGHGAKPAHDGERLRSFTALERRIIKEDCRLVQHSCGEGQNDSVGVRQVEAKGNEEQAKDADEAKPKHISGEVGGFRPPEQDLIPNERDPDEAMGNNGDKDSVVNET